MGMLPDYMLRSSHFHTIRRRHRLLRRDPSVGYQRSRAPGPYATQLQGLGLNRPNTSAVDRYQVKRPLALID